MNDSWLDRNRNVIFAFISLIAVGGGAAFFFLRPTQSPIEIAPVQATATPVPSPTAQPTNTPTPAPLRVYVTGAVVNSDVYILPPGSIIKDAIQAAGGFTPDAEPERINQALELKDQQQIHVPRMGQENPPPPVQGGQDKSNPVNIPETVSAGEIININTATLEQLDTLPGIGPAIAERIIEYRESTGGFNSTGEITQVSGIGEATFAKIEDLITVE